MQKLLRERAVSVPLVLGLCAVVPAGVLHFLGPQEVHISAKVHFLPIAISAGLAAGASVALTRAGARRGDGRAVLVGTAFSAMAALLAVHGLTTPGLLAEDNGVVAFSGALTLPVGGSVLALAALPGVGRARSVKPLLWLQAALLTLIAALGLVGILAPSLVPGRARGRRHRGLGPAGGGHDLLRDAGAARRPDLPAHAPHRRLPGGARHGAPGRRACPPRCC